VPDDIDWFPDPAHPGHLVRHREGRWQRWQPSSTSRARHPFVVVPAALGGSLIAALSALMLLVAPVTVAALIPNVALFAAVLWWVDRPLRLSTPSKLTAGVWGAAVATAVAMFTGTVVMVVAGDVVAAVIGAPVFEELAKVAGIGVALWVGHVRTAYSGVVYACWVGAGFALVENVGYLGSAALEGQLAVVFTMRVLTSPFAHLVFTVAAGAALGSWAGRRDRRSLLGAVAATAAAVLLHAAWNGGATVLALDDNVSLVVVACVAAAWTLVFSGLAVYVAVLRARTRDAASTWVRRGASAAGLGAVAADTLAEPGPWWSTSPQRAQLLSLRRELAGLGASATVDGDALLRAQVLASLLATQHVLPGGAGPTPGWYPVDGHYRWWTGRTWV
jgi:RsiW-degrading membrane proteinase PrsW (M82 family)